MATIPNKKSVVLEFVGTANAGDDLTVEIPNARHYTGLAVSVPADITAAAIQGNSGGGWLDLHTSVAGANQKIDLALSAINNISLQAPCIGGLRLVCRHAGGNNVIVKVHVTMSSSQYSAAL